MRVAHYAISHNQVLCGNSYPHAFIWFCFELLGFFPYLDFANMLLTVPTEPLPTHEYQQPNRNCGEDNPQHYRLQVSLKGRLGNMWHKDRHLKLVVDKPVATGQRNICCSFSSLCLCVDPHKEIFTWWHYFFDFVDVHLKDYLRAFSVINTDGYGLIKELIGLALHSRFDFLVGLGNV